jgi:hypothetical protein
MSAAEIWAFVANRVMSPAQKAASVAQRIKYLCSSEDELKKSSVGNVLA